MEWRRRRRKSQEHKREQRRSKMASSRRFLMPILCPTFRDHKLGIPNKFVEKYGDELSELVRLMVPTGVIWSVRVEKTDNAMLLHDGFRKFMEDNCIGFGYLLMFKYIKNSSFKVNIFNLGAYEIEYPSISNSATHDDANQLPQSAREKDDDSQHKKSDEHPASGRQEDRGNSYDGDDDDSSIEILDSPMLVSSNKSNRKISSSTNGGSSSRKHIFVGSEVSSRVHSGKRPVKAQSNLSSQAAKMSLPKNPLYTRTLKPYHFNKNILSLPHEFARLYLSCKSQFIKLQDGDGNEWEVHCISTPRKACCLTEGWNKFVWAKNLMPGDVCSFEPFQINGEVKLKVQISRAIENAANVN